MSEIDEAFALNWIDIKKNAAYAINCSCTLYQLDVGSCFSRLYLQRLEEFLCSSDHLPVLGGVAVHHRLQSTRESEQSDAGNFSKPSARCSWSEVSRRRLPFVLIEKEPSLRGTSPSACVCVRVCVHTVPLLEATWICREVNCESSAPQGCWTSMESSDGSSA